MILQPQTLHWVVALTAAAAVHVLVMVRMGVEQPVTHRAEDPGAQSITIALAPPPTAAPSEPTPVAESQPEPQPEPIPDTLESPVKTPELEEVEPEPEPEPEKKTEPEPTPEPEPEPKPESEPPLEPRPEPDELDDTAEAEPQEQSSDQRARQTADQRQSGATGGIQDAPPDYRTEVSAWLERHKEYPMSSRRKAEQGMAMVSFTFDREGNILDYTLLRATGHASLDEAVQEMLERADPLPKMPEHLTQARMTWTLPVYFRLN